jgi:hypothetical protein
VPLPSGHYWHGSLVVPRRCLLSHGQERLARLHDVGGELGRDAGAWAKTNNVEIAYPPTSSSW